MIERRLGGTKRAIIYRMECGGVSFGGLASGACSVVSFFLFFGIVLLLLLLTSLFSIRSKFRYIGIESYDRRNPMCFLLRLSNLERIIGTTTKCREKPDDVLA